MREVGHDKASLEYRDRGGNASGSLEDMPDNSETRWLTEEQNYTWRAVWSLMTWLPVKLEQQLRDDTGLSLYEYYALSQISEAPDRSIRLSELAQITNMTLSHLSRVIDRMMKSGWVERIPDPVDGRYTLGVLTDKGWEKVVEMAPGHVEAVQQAIFDHLTPEQARVLGETSAKVAEAVSPRGEVTGPPRTR